MTASTETPEQRARKLDQFCVLLSVNSTDRVRLIAAHIREAVAAEREAAALIAENYTPSSPSAAGEYAMRDMRNRIAAAIRSRP